MALTKADIDRLHRNRQATPGKIYKDTLGNLYSGTKDKGLHRESILSGELVGTTLSSIINNIGEYSREEIIELLSLIRDKVDQTEFDEFKKEAKCFSVAMGIAL